MPDLPVFPASENTVIPEKIYDRIWINEISIRGGDPNGDVNGEVKMTKYGMFPTGEVDADGQPILIAETWDAYKLGVMNGVIFNPNPTTSTTIAPTTPAPTTTEAP